MLNTDTVSNYVAEPMIGNQRKTFSIIVPIYGNEKNIPVTVPYMIDKARQFVGYEVEFIFVCDGSPDNSYEALKPFKHMYPTMVTIVNFSKNYSQGAAVHCGCDLSTGDVIGVISCDMQDPFDLFHEMLSAWEEGYKLVIATRKRRSDGLFSDFASATYHRLVNRFISNSWPKGGFDFFLMDREVAKCFTEQDFLNSSMQMTLLWPGYDYKLIEYDRNERKIGKSGYNLSKKIRLSLGTATSFSSIVSSIWGIAGAVMLMLSVAMLVLTILCLTSSQELYVVLFFAFCCISAFNTGLVLLSSFSVGEYCWRTYHRLLNRPRYIIEEKE